MWVPIQLTVDNGIDIFGSFLRDYGFEVNYSPSQIKYAPFYFWSGGLTDSAKPYAYHNYSPERFIDEFNSIMRNNLFLKRIPSNCSVMNFSSLINVLQWK